MTWLVVAALAFLGTHFVASTPLRPALINAMGRWPYVAAYSTLAFVTLGWMIWAYAQAPREILWIGLRHLPSLVMPFVFILIACGYWRNPTIVGAEKLLKSDDPARGIIRVTRHPIMWGIMLLAAAHIVAQVALHEGRRVFAFTRPGDAAAQGFARELGAVWSGPSDASPPEPLDAAIIFADILPILIGMGINLDFVKGEGPQIFNPITSPADVDNLRTPSAEENRGVLSGR